MQKITISTVALASIVKRVSKGLIKNKFLKYTGYIMISGAKEGLTFSVCDGSSVYEHKINKDYGITEDFQISVDGEKLLQLVSKLGRQKTELQITKTHLLVKCGGNYSFPIEEDNVPVVSFDELVPTEELNANTVPSMVLPSMKYFNSALAGLSKLVVDVRLMGYFVSNNKIVTTNSAKASSVTTDRQTEHEFYLTTRMVDLYSTIDDEEATIYSWDGVNIIKTPTKLIYGPVQPGKEDFPDLSGIFELEFEQSFTVSTESLLNALDRLKVFNSATFHLNIINGRVNVTLDPSKHTYEQLIDMDDISINYNKEFDINEFKDLTAMHTDTVTVHFMNENIDAVKLTSTGLTQFLATMGDD